MNTNAKHTPGKWTTKIRQPGTMLTVENETGEYVCSLLGGDEHKQENARLIASAPDLLAALKSAVSYLEANRPKGKIREIFTQLNEYENGVLKPARAAILRAEGKTETTYTATDAMNRVDDQTEGGAQ